MADKIHDDMSAALTAIVPHSEQLLWMTRQAYSDFPSSYTHSSMQAAILVNLAAMRAAKTFASGAGLAGLVPDAAIVSDAVKSAQRRIKADMEFCPGAEMSGLEAVMERLDWQVFQISRLAGEGRSAPAAPPEAIALTQTVEPVPDAAIEVAEPEKTWPKPPPGMLF